MSETIQPRSPLEGLLRPGVHAAAGSRAGLTIEERHDVAQFQLVARNGKTAELAQRVSRLVGVKGPLAPLVGAESQGLYIAATGPRDYWVLAENETAQAARKALGGLAKNGASLFDHSHGRFIVRLTGPDAVAVLARGTPLDLHPSGFPETGASHTVIAHIPALVARRGNPVCYDVSVARSYAGSFAAWLQEAARDFGYAIKASGA